MKWSRNFLITISLLSLFGCGGGGSSTPNQDTPIDRNLSKTSLIYNQSPKINEELKLSIEDNTAESSSDYIWTVINSPASSNLTTCCLK